MDINNIVTIISTLGFPIVACMACGFFIKYMFETFLKQIQDMREEHRSEVDKMTKAINNNTAVIQRLLDKEKEDAA